MEKITIEKLCEEGLVENKLRSLITLNDLKKEELVN